MLELTTSRAFKKAFLMIAGKAVEKFAMELENHQQLILAAAEVLIEIYAPIG